MLEGDGVDGEDPFGVTLPPRPRAVFERCSAHDIGDEVATWSQHLKDPAAAGGGQEVSTDDMRQKAMSVIAAHLQAEAEAAIAAGEAPLSFEEDQLVMQVLLDDMYGAGPLERLLADDRIENIDVNGCDTVFITYAGNEKVQGPPLWPSDAAMVAQLQKLAARAGTAERTFNWAGAQLNIQLPESRSRLFAVMGVTPRPCISVRRHRLRDVELADLNETGLFDACP